MVAPGSLDARYERLAGDENKRRELYVARTKLNYSVDDWLALPWWQRRLYVEGLVEEAQAIEAAANGDKPAHGGGGMAEALNAIYDGTIEDIAGKGYTTN